MLNYRLVTILVLSLFVFAPLGVGWASTPDANWYHPYLVWLLFIVSIMLWQQRKD